MSTQTPSPTASDPLTIYIIYNADATVLGKLRYAYRKLRSPPEPACGACDITHGGLSLSETSAFANQKRRFETDTGHRIVQWHRDELSEPLGKYVRENGVKLPVVIAGKGESEQEGFEVVMERGKVNACEGDAERFVIGVREWCDSREKGEEGRAML